jgi:hypothetical protein
MHSIGRRAQWAESSLIYFYMQTTSVDDVMAGVHRAHAPRMYCSILLYIRTCIIHSSAILCIGVCDILRTVAIAYYIVVCSEHRIGV